MGSSHSTPGKQGVPSGTPLHKHIEYLATQAAMLPQHAQTAATGLHGMADGLNNMAGGVTALGNAGANLQGAAYQAAVQQRDQGVYGLVMAQTAKQQGKTGGGAKAEGYFGGDSSEDPSKALKEYRFSLATATKDRIVRGLARALKQAGVDVDENASAEEIAQTLQSRLPNPKKDKKTFAKDAESQEEVCRHVANGLNNEFTPGAKKSDMLIDTSLGAVSICRQVADLVHSLSTGLHTEFLEVHASLTRILRNLEVLDEVLKEFHGKILRQVEGADLKPGADKELDNFNDVYTRAERERERQMQMLRQYLSVTLAPAKEELALAMREESETHDMIRRLKLTPGTTEFADSLAMAVSGLGTIAAVSARVDAALKDVGMGIEDYVKSSDLADLEKALDDKLMSGGVRSDDVGKFLKAVQTLKENYYRRDELDFDAVVGGNDRMTGLDRRVEKRKTERKLIVKQFIDKSTSSYDALLKAVQELGPNLGKQIPLSDKLEQLRNALSRLDESRLGALNLELALIGFYSDAAAREKKETFLANLRVVQEILNEVMGMDMYSGSSQYFAAMRAAIESLVRTIDFFSDVISKKYGSGDSGDSGDSSDSSDSETEVVGGQAPEELSSLPEIARSSYDLERAIKTFKYFYYVAKVRSNLRQTRKELEYYGEKYNDILGDAVAARLRLLQKEQTDKKADAAYNPAAGAPAAAVTTATKAKKFIDSEYACKKEFYRALQALDLYMKAFTDGIVADPDGAQKIKQDLDGVQIIGRWFVEETGDDLAAAFEMMPSHDGAAPVAAGANGVNDAGGAHYYEKVAASNESGNVFTPGVPQMGLSVDNADQVRAQVGKVFENFQALKNLTNAFIRIGSKFGGTELSRAVFMSPTQIYKALLDYMKCSALSLGIEAGGGAPVPTVRIAGGDQPVSAGGNGASSEVYFGSVYDGLRGNFAVEDRYFTFCVKAMAAKVMTVLGVYDLFERPSPVYELTPTRMIIGGADFDAIPDVIPEASELYFRLPRLVEFYKNLFAFDAGGAAEQISMLPEMEGVFSGIIRLIFQRVEGGAAASGDYSDLEVRALVREINGIYENFRSADQGRPITEALTAFVMEINRRYGLVKKEEWDTLQRLLRESRRAGEFGALNKTNYAILPGEEEYQSERRAPSDRYLGPGASSEAQIPGGKYNIDDGNWSQWDMLKAFREKLDGYFSRINPEEFTTFSFSTAIRQGEGEMRRAEGAAAKIGVAARLIQGSGSLATLDVGKAFMFHETVVVGLNLLNSIYTLLDRMRQRVIDTDVVRLRELIAAGFRGRAAGAPALDAVVIRGWLAGQGFTAGGAGPVGAVFDNAAVIAGRAGNPIPAATNYALMYAATDAARVVAPEQATATLATYCLNNSRLMGDLLEMVVGLTSTFQDLVQVRFPGTREGQMHLDFSGLRGLVQGLMQDVRFYMDMFRPHIAKDVIKKYEDKQSEGSLYWLEDKLLDGLVRGLPDEMAQEPDARAKTLEWMSRTVNRTYATLVGFNEVDLQNMTAANAAVGGATPLNQVAAPGGPNNREQYGRLFASLVYYDATANANSGLEDLARIDVTTSGGIGGLISTQRPVVQPGGGAVRQFPAAGNAAAASDRVNLWSGTLDGISRNRSLLMLFNQLLAQYLEVFYDAATGKIYRNLINSFANGSFSRAVMTQGNSLPDMFDGGAVGGALFGRRGDPLAGGILFESLGLVLRRLATDLNPTTQTSDHLTATLSEIPLYVRESFRANLPAFIKLFELVQKEGEFYKQLMSQTEIQVGRPYGPQNLGAAAGVKIALAGGINVTDAAPGPMAAGSTASSLDALANSPADSEGMRLVISRVIDGVSAGCYSISGAAADVLREMSDTALYLETQENSIEEYKSRYNKLPLMPLSSSLTFLRNLNPALGGDTRMMPVHSAGDESFKLMYGTRKLLGRPTQPFTLADAPGVRANVEAYNSAASGREKMDTGRFEDFLSHAVTALRFVVDTRNYRGILASAGGRGDPLRANLVKNNPGGAGAAASIGIVSMGNNGNAVYQLRQGTTPQMTLSITESSYQEQELGRIGKIVGGAGSVSLGQDREKEWIYNIIDMNIIPVNVHALMRGIPLAPIYNYVYTFEQMVSLMFGQTVETIESADIDQSAPNGISSTRQAFLKMLIEPYAQVPMATYGAMPQLTQGATNGFIQRIFRGDDSLRLGRPKFLSDQLYNKALFGTLVPTPYSFDEAGPPASGRMAAGYLARSLATPPGAPPAAGFVPAGQLAEWGVGVGPGATTRRAAAVAPPDQAIGLRWQYGALTYIGQADTADASSALKSVQLGANAPAKLQVLGDVGKARFDTTMVRNLFFVTNVLRMMRLKLGDELTQYRNVLVSNHGTVNPSVTEYGAISASSMAIPADRRFGPGNETASTRRYENEERLV